jgi:5-methylcytosine-specific restriction endonuclease McrA
MTWLEDLRGTASRNVVLFVKSRDEFRCQDCGSTEDLTIHHKVPRRWDASKIDDPENQVTLCRTCHDRREKRTR